MDWQDCTGIRVSKALLHLTYPENVPCTYLSSQICVHLVVGSRFELSRSDWLTLHNPRELESDWTGEVSCYCDSSCHSFLAVWISSHIFSEFSLDLVESGALLWYLGSGSDNSDHTHQVKHYVLAITPNLLSVWAASFLLCCTSYLLFSQWTCFSFLLDSYFGKSKNC